MNPPPRELDGAKVLLWVPLTEENKKTDVMKLYADGKEQAQFAALALAQYVQEQGSGVYLFYCDESWDVQNDFLYHDLDEAKSEAERQFTGIVNRWIMQ